MNGTINTKPNPSIVDVNVNASNASIEEVARLAAAFGVAFSPNAKIAGQLTANVHAQGPTSNLALNGNVSGTQSGNYRQRRFRSRSKCRPLS